MAVDRQRAFEAMCAEISDSDEEMPARGRPVSSSSMIRADSKVPDNNNRNNMAQSKGDQKSFRNNAYKMSKEEQEIENFGVEYQQSSVETHLEQVNTTKRWLGRPCGKGERSTMKCYVEREKQNFGLQTIYRCFLEGNDGQPARFMMSAKKKTAKQTSYYLISIDMNPSDDRGSENVLGKVRGNAVGSKYLITDHGLSPDKTVAPSMLRKEFAVVAFEFDSGGPSQIEGWIPAVSASGVPVLWQPDAEGNGIEGHIHKRDPERMFLLRNKQPKWVEAHGGHVLDFQGRVTESSVKNFQLCCMDNEDIDEVVLQFGRVGKNKFTMDLRFPLSPVQAFGICVACLDGKLADRKGYEFVKRLTASDAAPTDADGKAHAHSSSTMIGSSSSGGGMMNGSGNSSYNNMVGNSSSNNSSSTPSNSNSANGSGRQQMTDGSVTGSTSITGILRESIPSSQYLRDKWTRSFK